jgi:uncharacterized protein YbaR (Trm112 family)
MQREELVCTACGLRFRFDDFVEELGELVACPDCGSFEIEIDVLAQDAQRDAA